MIGYKNEKYNHQGLGSYPPASQRLQKENKYSNLQGSGRRRKDVPQRTIQKIRSARVEQAVTCAAAWALALLIIFAAILVNGCFLKPA